MKKKNMIGSPKKIKKTKSQPRKGKARLGLFLLMAGLFLVPTGVVLNNVIQTQLDEGIAAKIAVPDENDDSYDEWVSNNYEDAVPKYRVFTMWNLTNPDAVLAGGQPIMEEVGPYNYRQYDTKYDVEFSDDDDEVSYKKYSSYEYIGGGRDLNAKITNINPAYLGALEKAGTEETLTKVMTPAILNNVKEGVIDKIDETLAAVSWLEHDLGIGPFTLSALDLPDAEQVFYGEWANDRFPLIPWQILLLWGEINVHNLPFGIDLDIVGDIDIEAENFGDYTTAPADVNMVEHTSVYMEFLTFEQCQNLWNSSDPYSLTGMDVKEDPIWFDALVGDIDRKDTLMSTFSLSVDEIDLILDWLDSSLDVTKNGWITNTCNLKIEDWNSGLITTRTVEEWLFTAVDNLINNSSPADAKVGLFDNPFSVVEAEEAESDSYTMKTARDDSSEVGQIVEFRGSEDTTIWAEPTEVKGTDGTQFAPDVSKDEKLDVFISDLVRTVEFEYAEDTEEHGIDLLRFELTDETFEPNPTFFMTIEGIANMYADKGVPMFMSKPHFLDAELYLQSAVTGMNPDAHEHDTYLDIEPITGAVMNARKRLQANFEVTPTDQWYKNINTNIIPIIWLEEKGTITEELAEKFKEKVYGTLELKDTVFYSCLAVGMAALLPGTVVTTKQTVKRRASRKQKAGLLKQRSKVKMDKLVQNIKSSNNLDDDKAKL